MSQTIEAIDVDQVEHRINLLTPDVTELFEQAPVYAKTATIAAEPARPGEIVQTRLKNGKLETENTFANPGDMLVTNPGGERYVVPADKFRTRYESTATPGVWKATGLVRAIQNPTGVDVVTTAPWNEDIRGDADCMLVAIVTEDKPDEVDPKERYIIGKSEFDETYAPFEQVYDRQFGVRSREITASQRAAQTARVASLIDKYSPLSSERFAVDGVYFPPRG